MREIRMITAFSGRDLAQDREELESFLCSVDAVLEKQDCGFRVKLWNGSSDEALGEKTPDTRNQRIAESSLVYLLVGQEADAELTEAFETAMAHFREKQTPDIRVFFREASGEPEAESVQAFRRHLKETECHSRTFSHMDAVKGNLLLAVTRALPDALDFRDGQARLYGTPVLPLDNLPACAGHRELRRLWAQRAERMAALARLWTAYRARPEESARFAAMMEASRKLNRRNQEIQGLEAAMLRLYTHLEGETERPLTWRQREARRCLDAGDYQGALAVLRDGERRQDLAFAEQLMDQMDLIRTRGMEEIRGYLAENRTRTAILETRSGDVDILSETRACYEESAALARKYGMEREVLRPYAAFLRRQGEFAAAVQLCGEWEAACARDGGAPAEQAEIQRFLVGCYTEDTGDRDLVHPQDALRVLRGLAEKYQCGAPLAAACGDLADFLEKRKQMEEAERLFAVSLDIFRELAADAVSTYGGDFARICARLADLRRRNGHPEEAEKRYREALRVTRDLETRQPCAHLPRLAGICGNLADLLAPDERRFAEAETLYREALDIYRKLAENNPGVYVPSLAGACEHLADMLCARNQEEEAVELYREARYLFRHLAEENPAVYGTSAAEVCREFAGVLHILGRENEAMEVSREALAAYQALAEENPARLPDAAQAGNSLALLLSDAGQWEEAEALHCAALDLYRELAGKAPMDYTPEVIQTCVCLADLMERAGRRTVGEWFLRQALDTIRKAPKVCAAACAPGAADACYRLAVLLSDTDREEEAAQYYQVARTAYRALAEEDPAAFVPFAAGAALWLGRHALYQRGDTAAARALFREVLSLYEGDPDYAEMSEDLRRLLETLTPETHQEVPALGAGETVLEQIQP